MMPPLTHGGTQRDGAAVREVLSFAAVGCHGREWWTPAFALAGFGVPGRLASSAALTVMRPPLFVNFTAFDSKLRTICCTFSRSA